MTTSQANTGRYTARTSAEPARDPMQEFANRIVAELERGVKPWVRPWDPDKTGGPQAPFNPITGKRYHGINVLILGETGVGKEVMVTKSELIDALAERGQRRSGD